MSYSALFIADLGVAVLVAAAAGAALHGALTGHRVTGHHLPLLLGLTVGLLAGRAALGTQLAGYGWEFAARRVAYQLPLVAVPTLVALGIALRARPLTGTDRNFQLEIDRRLGFQHGRVGYYWSVNGQIFPRMPMLMVSEGDLVRVKFVNRTTAHHPMHLHGHHVLVLSRNGEAATGSPWWTDTLNVAPGESYVVAFLADNPGIWLDHCHDLQHAADGFVMHLAYEGVSTPYAVGENTHNRPE